jgi:hypothetical protein
MEFHMPAGQADAVALPKADHRKVEDLFERPKRPGVAHGMIKWCRLETFPRLSFPARTKS